MASLETVYSKKLREDIRVKKTFTAPLSALYVEDGFNIRYSEITEESVEDLIRAYSLGQPVPPIVVEVMKDNRFKIIAGHRRFKALTVLSEKTLDNAYSRVEVRSFEESPELTVVYMMGENGNGRTNLNAVDISIACQKLADMGNSAKRIGELLNFSEPKVAYHLTIAKLTDEIKTAIVEGRIAADYAVELYRRGTEKAVKEALEKAGDKKATRANTGGWKASDGPKLVRMLASVPVKVEGDSVTLTLSNEEWQKLSYAIGAVSVSGLGEVK